MSDWGKIAHVGYCVAVQDVIVLLEDDDLARGKTLEEYRQELRAYHQELIEAVSTCNDPTCSISRIVDDMIVDAKKEPELN